MKEKEEQRLKELKRRKNERVIAKAFKGLSRV